MSFLLHTLPLLLAAPGALAGGSGPYPSSYFEDASLPDYTFYQPTAYTNVGNNPPCTTKIPIIVWGNGGCFNYGLLFQDFLEEVTSYNALAIAPGPPDKDRATQGTGPFAIPPDAIRAPIDWVVANAGKPDTPWSHLDGSRIAVWGQSCGGLQAYKRAYDPEVNHLGIFDSGELEDNGVPANITKPMFYVLGGPKDALGEANSQRDYARLPATTPAWLGNHTFGHGGSFNQSRGGPAGAAAIHMLQWLLQGDESAKAWFLEGGGATADGFVDFKSKNLDAITVSAATSC